MTRRTLRIVTSPALAAALALAFPLVIATACEQREPTVEERAGEAAERAGDTLDEAGEEIEDEVDDHTDG